MFVEHTPRPTPQAAVLAKRPSRTGHLLGTLALLVLVLGFLFGSPALVALVWGAVPWLH